ncbi:hypothetical protein AB6A40_009107 [Gnathostoma spinigerum]|uniref:Uncharacterized protein n=1 Tax=Gnathostoma spinigerum TaxID=75299 RepID=A0ABD6ERC9_9BILA
MPQATKKNVRLRLAESFSRTPKAKLQRFTTFFRRTERIKEYSGHMSDAEVTVDWTPNAFTNLQSNFSRNLDSSPRAYCSQRSTQPRLLHPSHSLADALHRFSTDKRIGRLLFVTDSQLKL